MIHTIGTIRIDGGIAYSYSTGPELRARLDYDDKSGLVTTVNLATGETDPWEDLHFESVNEALDYIEAAYADATIWDLELE